VTHGYFGSGRNGTTLLQSFQPSPARPSDRSLKSIQPNTLHAIHCYVSRGNICNEKSFSKLFPGKLEIQRWSNFEILWPASLWRRILHYSFLKICKESDNLTYTFLDVFLLLSVAHTLTAHDVQKNTPVKLCVYLFILHLCVEFHVFRMQTKLCRSCPYHIKG
jgi:hypothetical protein